MRCRGSRHLDRLALQVGRVTACLGLQATCLVGLPVQAGAGACEAAWKAAWEAAWEAAEAATQVKEVLVEMMRAEAVMAAAVAVARARAPSA